MLQPKPITAWKDALFLRCGISTPDGRSLYAYRLTESEFNELEKLLIDCISRLSEMLPTDVILSGFENIFVLYASEWWRRRYDGSHWSWDPILQDIGANPEEWPPIKRSKSIQRGLKYWQLKVGESGTLRFLGAVAVQGGLPLRLLAEARGKIGHLLKRVLQLASNASVTRYDLHNWVESLQGTLPKSYRQAAIYDLLTDVAWTVLKLKDEAKLTSSEEAIAKLDRQIPSWRERFPIPVEDEHAQGLIEQLMRDAASVRIERRSVSLMLDRRLEGDATGWILQSSLMLPETIKAKEITSLFGAKEDDLPRTLELELAADGQRIMTAMRRMAGHDAYRIERKPWGCSGTVAIQEHILRLFSPDGRNWSATLPKGDALDEDLPWVFSVDDLRLLRQGSGGVAVSEALLALPESWAIEPQEGSEILESGHLESTDRKIFRIRGSIHTYNNAGFSCRIRTGQAGSAEDIYEWRGDRIWLDFKNPKMAFRGIPDLYRTDQDGGAHRMEGHSGCSSLGTAVPIHPPLGPTSIRHPATGEIKQRIRTVILPKDALLSLVCRDAMSGSIRFDNWGAVSARVLTPNVRGEPKLEGTSLLLLLSVPQDTRTPEQIEIEVLWGHTTTPVKLVVPFPARGVRAFDANGKELCRDALLAAHQLLGVRMLVLGGQQNTHTTLELSPSKGKSEREYTLRSLPGMISTEVRLQDYSDDIQHLLSIDERPDSIVSASVRIGGNVHFKLRFARYAALLERAGETICLDTQGVKSLTSEEISKLPVMALRLEQPSDEAVPLIAHTSEGVSTGGWLFSPENREPGAWLIYSGPDAQISLRPTLWTVGGETDTKTAFASAIGIPNQAEREKAWDGVISAMATDFHDPSWDELETMVSQLGHLPLAALDIWRRFVHSPQAMAALVIRFSQLRIGFLERFAQELPFSWETVSFAAWKQAMKHLKQQTDCIFGEAAGACVFKNHLDSRIKDLAARHGALNYLLGIASVDYLPESQKQIQPLKCFGKALAEQRLFKGETSQVMQLCQRHRDDQWPTNFNKIISQARCQDGVADFLCPVQYDFRDGVINIPPLLAAQVVASQTDPWFADPGALHLLWTCHSFDPDWFDEAYNMTIARCLAAGLLDI